MEKVMESGRIQRAQKENASKVTYLDNRQIQQQFQSPYRQITFFYFNMELIKTVAAKGVQSNLY